ncbi:PadR family transcriptional regulator [Streptacidiphilus sp. P02-A3a]|uniref:PadR family transcriptional regulator n=1 Tax=Streptacidiphilus sp. P02-A3a TaxID=2704468 RepID=UPI0015FA2EC8|nr:PadR family transcriptional regulator [Streptacidiphilus sp. P02-A3a]QMU69059.1 PadR family transcriptional regulator [Streptacidiphilus sp. P02-A3a]
MARRTMSNPLALAVLAFVAERPSHPYEIAQSLRSRGKDRSIKINYGSLYSVVQTLERHGFIEAAGTERDGRRPERTVYAVTESGRAELRDWLSELLGTPAKEYPRFESALSLMGVLPPEEARTLLEQRVARLEADTAAERALLAEWGSVLPGIFLVEGEYALAMATAEAEWTKGLLRRMADGSLTGMDGWRQFHATGQAPPEWTELEARARAAQED